MRLPNGEQRSQASCLSRNHLPTKKTKYGKSSMAITLGNWRDQESFWSKMERMDTSVIGASYNNREDN
jgi:hypothetical protein